MIGKLKGIIDSYGEDFIVLDVQGVGYLVHCSARTLQALPAAGEAATLSIETHVREDQIRLFGFLSDAEREWFRLLQTVQGVGAKVALSVLSTFKPGDLASAIAMGDKAAIRRAPGVGPKVAERLVIELKDKAPAYSDLDPAVISLSGALSGQARAAAGARRGLGAGQSRLRPAAGGRRHFRRQPQRGRGRGDRATDPARAEGAFQVSAKVTPRCSDADRALVEAASEAIRKRYRYDWQEVGAALRTRSGKVFTGVSLDAYLGRMAVCAEAVALGQAITNAGETGIETIVAVRHPPPEEKDRPIAVVSPCGACRELIWDYDRNARVIVPGPNGPEPVGIGELHAEQVQPRTRDLSRDHHAPPPRHRRAPRGGHRRNLAAAAAAVRVHRPAAGARQPLGVHRGGAGAQRSARPCAVRRPAGARQDHAGADRRRASSASTSAPPPGR